MAIDSKSSLINGFIPSGLYHYYIPSENVPDYGGFLGHASCVESLTYNPFINKSDLPNLIECSFDSGRYGSISLGAGKLLRIKHIGLIEKKLCDLPVYENTINYLPAYLQSELKCQSYPFTYYMVTDYMNTPLTLKPQEIERLEIYVKTCISREGYYQLYCKNNKGDYDGKLEGIVCKNSMQLPVNSTYYNQFFSSQINSFVSQNNLALMENDLTYSYDNQILNQNVEMMELDKTENLVNGSMGLIGSAFEGDLTGAIRNSFSIGMNLNKQQVQEKVNTINRMNIANKKTLSDERINRLSNAKIKDAKNTPNTLKTIGNDFYFNAFNSEFKIDIVKFQADEKSMEKIANYFYRYGYKINNYHRIIINKKKYFTYVKTDVCNIMGTNIPKEYLLQLKNILNRGITFWNMETANNYVGNYNKVNSDIN